jgi:potassium-transporting ATPase ATP-binding subunit
VALLVCLIPTTIGGLLSAIGIAGMDRLVQRNVIAMSGRAVEAAGDVDDAAARQDRHDHPRQPPGQRSCRPRRRRPSWPTAAQLASLADETPEGRRSSSWRRALRVSAGASRRARARAVHRQTG